MIARLFGKEISDSAINPRREDKDTANSKSPTEFHNDCG